MSIAIAMPGRDVDTLIAALRQALPEVEVAAAEDIRRPETVELAVVWRHRPGSLAAFPRLRAALAYGAGVDFLLGDETLDPTVQLGRLAAESLRQQVSAYVLACLLPHARGLGEYADAASRNEWAPVVSPVHRYVGILGAGRLGEHLRDCLELLGWRTRLWGRTARDGVLAGRDQLLGLATACDYLVCTLPLTDDTKGVIGRKVLAALPNHAGIVNVGRGECVDDVALLEALDREQISHAWLDVFEQEPLPADHPFWRHPRVSVTPHIAGITDPQDAAEEIAAAWRQFRREGTLPHPVCRTRGY